MTARIAGHPSERRFHMQSAGLAKATTMRAFRVRGDTDPHSSRNDLPAEFETVGGGDDGPAAPR